MNTLIPLLYTSFNSSFENLVVHQEQYLQGDSFLDSLQLTG